MEEQTAIRATWIKAGAVSMAHMRHAATVGRDDSPAMRWGRLVHMSVLQPAVFAALPVWDGDKRSKAWKEFCELHGAAVEIISSAERDRLDLITDAVLAVLPSLPPMVATEVDLAWRDDAYGAARARVDAILDGKAMLELKTAKSIDERSFMSQCYSLGYHLQLGWYAHGLELTAPCYVLAVESKPPHCTAVYRVPESILAVGYQDAARIATQYRECERAGKFPGPLDGQVIEYEFPAWAGDESGFVPSGIGEQEVF
jgi:hypothetical protein